MRIYKLLLPGFLMAATGVGAGDLITAGLAGVKVGNILIWAPLVGALLKWFLSEGLTRWQMDTDKLLLKDGLKTLEKVFSLFF